jgi:hypothetical protein
MSNVERRDGTMSGREARARYEAARWATLLESVESLVAEAREAVSYVDDVPVYEFKTDINLFSI